MAVQNSPANAENSVILSLSKDQPPKESRILMRFSHENALIKGG
jgi:hypothetical protein